MPEVKTKIPALGIGFAFILTAIGARIFSWYFPWIHWEPVPGVHIHHYVYGIFILAIAGYLAMIFKGPRATSWIALLYGAIVSDWLDGPIARRLGTSEVGAMFDIEADSWLTLCSSAAAVTWGGLPTYVVAPPIARFQIPPSNSLLGT